MKIVIMTLAFSILTMSQAYAGPSLRPQLCSDEDLATMGEAFAEMAQNGIDQQRREQSIGVRGGDCNNVYSLETSAEIPHPANMPRPRCAIIFVLSAEDQKSQATWVLDTLGKTYQTATGKEISLCSQVSGAGPGPFPGATVHN